MTYTYIDESEADELYRDFLDEVYGEIEICGIVFEPSHILDKCDPIAYRCGFNDWLDANELTTEESEAEDA